MKKLLLFLSLLVPSATVLAHQEPYILVDLLTQKNDIQKQIDAAKEKRKLDHYLLKIGDFDLAHVIFTIVGGWTVSKIPNLKNNIREHRKYIGHPESEIVITFKACAVGALALLGFAGGLCQLNSDYRYYIDMQSKQKEIEKIDAMIQEIQKQ